MALKWDHFANRTYSCAEGHEAIIQKRRENPENEMKREKRSKKMGKGSRDE